MAQDPSTCPAAAPKMRSIGRQDDPNGSRSVDQPGCRTKDARWANARGAAVANRTRTD
jgi:hypothetical protein